MSTIIITGASRGIGKATASFIAKDFHNVVLISRTGGDALDAAKKEVESNGVICHAYKLDVTDYQKTQEIIDEIADKTGSIDVLINNAGISHVGLFMDMTPDEWKHILDTNLTSIYNVCHTVLPHMIKNKSGKIINISSVWGICGASCEVAYSATKGAINSFTRALAKELAPSNIAVNAIAFGAVDTDMNSHLTKNEKESLEYEIPYGKMATPLDAANCIKNIINMPNYMTGEVVKFDGAWI